MFIRMLYVETFQNVLYTKNAAESTKTFVIAMGQVYCVHWLAKSLKS